MRTHTKFGIVIALVLAIAAVLVVTVSFDKDSPRGQEENASNLGTAIPSQADSDDVSTTGEMSASESSIPVNDIPATRPARKDPSLNVKAFQSPEEYVELLWRHPFSFERAVYPLGQDAVRPLLTLLDDPEHIQFWSRISFAISIVDREHESTEALLRYIRRKDDWRTHLQQSQLLPYVVGKIATLGHLGLVADQQALDVAKSALTVEGAKTLVGEWLDDCAPHTEWGADVLIAYIQGQAARAIVRTGDAAGIEQVEDLYELLSSTKEESLPEATDVWELKMNLVTALATRDLIHDVGRERYLEILTDSHARNSILERYREKYVEAN